MDSSHNDDKADELDKLMSLFGGDGLDLEIVKSAILDHDSIAVLVADDDGNYLFTNEAASRLFGYTRREFMLMNIRDIRLMDGLNPMKQYKEYKNNGTSAGVLHFLDKTDQQRAGLYRARRISQDLNLSIMVDVTDHFATYDDVIDRLNEQVDVLNNLPAIAFRYHHREDGTSMFSYVSDNAAKLLRIKNPKSYMECSIGDLVIDEDYDDYVQSVNDAIKKGEPFSKRARMRLGDGTVAEFEIRSYPIKKQGETVYYGTYLLL